MFKQLNYHKNLSVLHYGCEKPTSYLIPFESVEAISENRADSQYFRSLCGEWKFLYYPSVNEVEDFTADEWNIEDHGGENIKVPMNWQMNWTRDYDKPHYINSRYPYPMDPPNIPVDNPCGLYERTFYIDEDTLQQKDIQLVFEGVDSCFYLYVNGQFVAYSQVSHSTTVINIGAYLHEGYNRLHVLVLKWCDGSYLEGQDKIRLSGIFREVYLLLREPIRITDLYVRSSLSAPFDRATISAEITLNGPAEVKYVLHDPDGKNIGQGSVAFNGTNTISFEIENPLLWNDETPQLYRLELQCENECFRQEIGIRSFEVKGKILYVNGKKVKGKGVNRHDSHPILGYATPVEHMIKDLYLLKAHNINMVRASHYPNDPRFLEYCDRLGFYVCNEADLEAHGMRKGGNPDGLTDNPEWREAYLDRAKLLFERDKNHACILMWSLGNESGIGQNHRAMADYLHNRMPNCIVHSEDVCTRNVQQYFNAETEEERSKIECDYIDVESRMYPSIDECRDAFLHNPHITKPLYLCEYSHSMGNSAGDFEEYWQEIYANDSFFGGCVWELTDHSVNIGTVSNPKYIYGGHFGTVPNDGNFCIDGLVYPDRRPHTALLELKQVLRPCRLTSFNLEDHTITLFNYRYFTDLSDLDLFWTVENNGVVKQQGRITNLDIPPQTAKTYALPISAQAFEGICTLNLFYRCNRAYLWSDAGYEYGFDQMELSDRFVAPVCRTNGLFGFEELNNRFVVTVGETIYTLDKHHGVISSIVSEGKEMLATPILPTIWRAPIDNDRYIRVEWLNEGYDRMQIACQNCRMICHNDTEAEFEAVLNMGAKAIAPILNMTIKYHFSIAKGLEVHIDAQKRDKIPFLPRFGMWFQMPEGNEYFSYLGRGPMESYEDKRHASRFGRYTSTVTDHFEHYIRPQENMAHTDTRMLTVADVGGHGLTFMGNEETEKFSFNCSHYTTEMLTAVKYDYELIPLPQTVVHLDYRHSGIGSGSCGPQLADSLKLKDQRFSFSFRVMSSFSV